MKIIMKAIAGSHLFGLNTEKSDKDYKGVYLPSADDILLGKFNKSINQSTNNSNNKNNSSDIDTELFSLDKFMNMLKEGQTVAIELLFTPDEFILEKHPLWDEIVSKRNELVHKNVVSFIGYAKQQAAKYGIRGTRMGSVEKVLETLKNYKETYPYSNKLFNFRNQLLELTKLEYVHIVQVPKVKNDLNEGYDEHFEVIGKKYPMFSTIDYVINSLQKAYDEFGTRSKLAKMNQGVDWKAVSHALRVIHQGKVLLTTGSLAFPLEKEQRDFILLVKKGELDFTTIVQPEIEKGLKELLEIKQHSNLPDSIEINHIILDIYRKVIKEEI
jgi:hypothetical protein